MLLLLAALGSPDHHASPVQVLLDEHDRAKLADTGLAVVLSSCSHRIELGAKGTYVRTCCRRVCCLSCQQS